LLSSNLRDRFDPDLPERRENERHDETDQHDGADDEFFPQRRQQEQRERHHEASQGHRRGDGPTHRRSVARLYLDKVMLGFCA
jgi:hypothetical protein